MEIQIQDIKYNYGKFKVKTNQIYPRQDIDKALNNRYTKEETYNKDELNSLITTPDVQYVSVTATEQITDVTDVLPTTGAADTIYRVGNWDGSQFDASVYSEYAWNASQYVYLSTKTQIGEVFDISAYHATGGVLATYANLAAALDSNNGGGVPQSLQKGGMSVKFVQIPDNKYVQFRYMGTSIANADFTNVDNWQGVDDKIIANSKNIANSGAVLKEILNTTIFSGREEIDNTINSFSFSPSDSTFKNISGYGCLTIPCEKGKYYDYKGFTPGGNVTGALFSSTYPELNDVGSYIYDVNGVVLAPDNGYLTFRVSSPNLIDATDLLKKPRVFELKKNGNDFVNAEYMSYVTGKDISSIYTFDEGYFDSNLDYHSNSQYWKCAIIDIHESMWGKTFSIDGVGNMGSVTSFLLADGTIIKITGNGNPGSRITDIIPKNAIYLYYSFGINAGSPYFSIESCFANNLVTLDKMNGIVKVPINLFPAGSPYGFYTLADAVKSVHESQYWRAVKMDVTMYRSKIINLSAIRGEVTYSADTFFEFSDGTFSEKLGTSTIAPFSTKIPNNASYIYISLNKNTEPYIYINGVYSYEIDVEQRVTKGSKKPVSGDAVYNFTNISYNLVKRKSVVSFIFDDNNAADVNMKKYCDDKGVKCGFAIVSMSDRYIDYYNEGFSILAHGDVPSGGWNETNLRSLINTDLTMMNNAGIMCKGWVTPSSELPVELRPVVYDYFEYGYTIYKGADTQDVYMPYNSKSYALWRSNMDNLTEAECKAIIDEGVMNNAMVCFYSHTNITEAKFKAIIDYALAHSQVMAPDDAVGYFFAARHNEDLTSQQ